MRRIPTALTLALAALLSACATSSPDVIQRGDAQRLSTIVDATVLNVRPVVVDGSQSGGGGAAGAVIGGVAGSSVGGRREAVAVGVLGAVAGAVIGNAIERQGTRENALEILVQLRNGERRAVVQSKGEESFRPGDQVIVITTGGKVRVALNPTGLQQAPLAPKPAPALGERS